MLDDPIARQRVIDPFNARLVRLFSSVRSYHRPHRSRSREGVIHRWTLHTECARAGWATVTAVYHLRLRAIAHLRLRASVEVSRCRAHAPRALARRGPPLQGRSSTFQKSYGFLAAAVFSSARAPDSVFAKP